MSVTGSITVAFQALLLSLHFFSDWITCDATMHVTQYNFWLCCGWLNSREFHSRRNFSALWGAKCWSIWIFLFIDTTETFPSSFCKSLVEDEEGVTHVWWFSDVYSAARHFLSYLMINLSTMFHWRVDASWEQSGWVTTNWVMGGTNFKFKGVLERTRGCN